ncbi:MAG: metallophosphoesterase [Candidatus Aenigmarchaeota archaeon]|nr:metallophosphoesterase [Candidatus Aenigmarchaeota archaeon]
MKFLILADVHGDFLKLSQIMKKEKGKYDAIIAPGDFTDMHDIPDGFTQLEIAEIVICRMMSSKKPVFAVPGNQDPYGIMEIFKDYGINIHADSKIIDGLPIMGWGGAMTPFDTRFEPTEEETKKYINETYKEMNNEKFILVVHNPPYNTKLDMVTDKKHVGSRNIRNFIERTRPVLAVSAHIHESDGDDKIGDTTLFYPGPVFQGKYGIAEINKNGKVSCETKNVS